MATKEALHRLIDEIPETELELAERFLARLRERDSGQLPQFLRNAPFDDEPETDEERQAVLEAYEDLARDDVISHDVVRREREW